MQMWTRMKVVAVTAGGATALALALAVEAAAQDTERVFGVWRAYSTVADQWPVYGVEADSVAGAEAMLHIMCFGGDAHATVWWDNELPDPDALVRLAIGGDEESERWVAEPDLLGPLSHPAPLALTQRLSAGSGSVDIRAVSLYGGDLKSTFSLDGFRVAITPLLRTCGG